MKNIFIAFALFAAILLGKNTANASCEECISKCESQFEANKKEIYERLKPENKSKYGNMALELQMPEVYLGNAVKMSATGPYIFCVSSCNSSSCSQTPQEFKTEMSEFRIESKASDYQKWSMARPIEEIKRCTCVRERKKLNDPTCQFNGDINAAPAGEPIPCCCPSGTFDCNACSEMDDNCLPPYVPSVSSQFGGKDLVPQWNISNPCQPGDAECKQKKCDGVPTAQENEQVATEQKPETETETKNPEEGEAIKETLEE